MTMFEAAIAGDVVTMAMALLRMIRRVITRNGQDGMMERLRFYLPYFLGVAACVFALILMKKGALSEFRPETAAGYLAFAAVVIPYGALLSQGILRSSTITMEDNEESVESVFRRLQIGTSCYVAFAHGANDVANSIAPVFGIYLAYRSGLLPDDAMVAATGVPLWVLVLGGLGIATGTGLLGRRVIETLGERVGFGQKHLAHARQLRSGVGGRLGVLAGNENVHVAAHLQGSGERLGVLVGQGNVVVIGNEKNGHVCVPFLACPYRTPASFFSLSTSSATEPTLTPALRPSGSAVLSTLRRGAVSTP